MQGKGFSKAMTAKEAQAFVGDVLCPVTILEDDKLFLVAPSSPPESTFRRHRRDTSSEAMELTVRHCSAHALITVIITNFTLRSMLLVFSDHIRQRRVESRLCSLWEEIRGSSLHHHSCCPHSHDPLHCSVDLLLQVTNLVVHQTVIMWT